MAGGDLFDAGQRGKLRKKLFVKGDLGGNGIAFVGQGDIKEQGVLRVKAGINVKNVEHALDEQSGTDEQGESQCGLRHDEAVMQVVAAAARGSVGCEFSEGAGRVRA